jgi:predicted dehydrogenase
MNKIRWGIISTAKIGVKQVIPAMQQGEFSEVTAIASRSLEQARETAKQLKIPKYYGSYEELLADSEIDAIYNPLPNNLHCEWSIRAMEAGKHILCEKPLGLTCEEVEMLIRTRDERKVKAGEAFMVKAHPQWTAVYEKVVNNEIGSLRLIQGMFSYHNIDPQNIRNIPETGGGAMWDIGCYPVTLSRYLFREEPIKVAASLELDPDMNTDRLGTVMMDFPGGKAVFGVSTQLVPFQSMHIFGTREHLEVPIPFNAPNDRPCLIHQDRGDILRENISTHPFETVDQYTLQGDAFSRAILDNSEVPSTFEDGLANTRVLRAIFRAAAEGRWVRLE